MKIQEKYFLLFENNFCWDLSKSIRVPKSLNLFFCACIDNISSHGFFICTHIKILKIETLKFSNMWWELYSLISVFPCTFFDIFGLKIYLIKSNVLFFFTITKLRVAELVEESILRLVEYIEFINQLLCSTSKNNNSVRLNEYFKIKDFGKCMNIRK